ncbi:MAG: ABC transporter permease [Chloroflexi bacterium]|nr:ABC transporter permease [Chloroflexota bacterium]
MPHASRRALRVWQRNRDVYLRLWRAELMPPFFESLVILLAMGVGLGAYVNLGGGGSYLQFIAPGLVASYAMFAAAFECTYGSYFRMETQRTFDAIIATPLSIEDVIAGEVLWGATRAAWSSIAVLAVISPFGLVESWWAVAVPLLAFGAGVLFSGIALVFTAFAPTLTSFNYFITMFLTPMFFFSDVFFPLEGLPAGLQAFGRLLPLTPFARLTRALTEGRFSASHWADVAYIAVLAVVFFYAALILMRRRLIK